MAPPRKATPRRVGPLCNCQMFSNERRHTAGPRARQRAAAERCRPRQNHEGLHEEGAWAAPTRQKGRTEAQGRVSLMVCRMVSATPMDWGKRSFSQFKGAALTMVRLHLGFDCCKGAALTLVRFRPGIWLLQRGWLLPWSGSTQGFDCGKGVLRSKPSQRRNYPF